MRTQVAQHKTTGNLHEVQIYGTLVYFVERMETISRKEFDEYFTILS